MVEELVVTETDENRCILYADESFDIPICKPGSGEEGVEKRCS